MARRKRATVKAGFVMRSDRFKFGELNTGTRIYYTGDVANHSWWGSVESEDQHNVFIRVDDGQLVSVFQQSIGNLYQGHCDPRFVTEEAFKEYQQQ